MVDLEIMSEVKWIKLTTDMFDNRKIKHLRKLPQGDSIVLIWVMLLTMAGRCNAGGMIYLTENIPYTTKMLADELDFEESIVLLSLEALQRFNMVEYIDNNLCITNWEEYQSVDKMAELREYNRIAKQKSRAKLKASKDVNDMSMTSQRCQDTEEEKEEEKEKEKESHSFILSASEDEKEKRKQTILGGKLGKGVVMLSKEQIDDLLDKLSIDEFDKYVNIVADCELSGKSFKKKTHYQAILDMAEKDRRCRK